MKTSDRYYDGLAAGMKMQRSRLSTGRDGRPFWQHQVCPAWCTAGHSDGDGFVDRYHYGEDGTIRLSTEDLDNEVGPTALNISLSPPCEFAARHTVRRRKPARRRPPGFRPESPIQDRAGLPADVDRSRCRVRRRGLDRVPAVAGREVQECRSWYPSGTSYSIRRIQAVPGAATTRRYAPGVRAGSPSHTTLR